MAAQDYTAVVQQLYISYFGRPADYYGLQNFSAQLDAMGAPKTFAEVQAAVQADGAGTTALSRLVNTFSSSEESIALYGTDTTQVGISKFVAAIYENVLGRPADLPGFNYWVEAITSGAVTMANAAAAITQGALTNTTAQGLLDAQAVNNKVAVATAFTTALDTPAELNAYSGEAAAAAGRGLLSGVNSSTNVTAYQATINSTISSIVTGSAPISNLVLTEGVDNIVGTNANDTITALVRADAAADNNGTSTLNSGDVIDGGAGIDTLNLIVGKAGSVLPSTATVKNVEIINITGVSNIGAAGVDDAPSTLAVVDASYFAGSTTINLVGATGATATVNGLAGKTLGVQGKTEAAVTGNFGTATSATVQLNGASNAAGTGNAAIALGGAAVKTVTINGSGAATVTAAGLVETLKINATGATTINASSEATSLKTIDASGSTAGVTIANGGTAEAPVNYTAVETITTGSGNDTFTVGLTTAGKTATVNSGAGNDKITVAADAVKVNINAGAGDDTITFNRALTTTDIVNGGEGKDTLSIVNSTIAASDLEILKATVTNVETLKFANLVTGVDAAVLNQFSTFSFSAAGGTVTKVADVQNVVAAGDVDVTAAGYVAATETANATYAGKLTVDVTGGTAAQAGEGEEEGTEQVNATVTARADSITLNVKATPATSNTDGIATFAELTGDVKSATVNLTNSVFERTSNTATEDAVATFTLTTSEATDEDGATTNLGNLTSLTLTGNGNAVVVNGATGSLATIDATGLTGKAAFGGSDVTTGLTYTTSANVAETIKLGASHDVINFSATSSTYAKMDTIEGFSLVKDAAGLLDTEASDSISISGLVDGASFTKAANVTGTTFGLVLTNLGQSTTADHVVFQYDGNTYIYADTGANGLGNDDVVIKLTGTAVDLDLLVSALNAA
ncbi:DUF4214 domain-containing protein [Massilia sp. YIM B02443]|uniref:DUF4214 domain-containing protein n=1 Tax=Massilia sp. YIM B02443 TaxID=3050127 RepID=UPI0025B6B59E|nr:DUF4214 domain-containing protein [Massilia sp. YIM B02443]MDN4035479.1 DUF4214 domain-containing protein [Massilia sp. YIM B02443]